MYNNNKQNNLIENLKINTEKLEQNLKEYNMTKN